VRWLVLPLMLVSCGGAGPSGDCIEGETRECYQGPPGTQGVGICVPGVETCSNGTFTGSCVGDVTPFVEHCDGRDEDCSGEVDDVEGSGGACAGPDGCEGAMACAGEGVACVAPTQNECGVCGGPPVPGVGAGCSDGVCDGFEVCNLAGDATECNAPAANACGVCGGPVVTGVGEACSSADGCTGTNACNAQGTAAPCNAPAKNACELCGGPAVAVGGTCSGARGCVGVAACNAAGDAAECQLDASCGHIVISELATGSSICPTDEYIELYNPTLREVPLAGYTLRVQAASGSFTRLITFPATATLASHGYLLVASSRATNPACPTGYTGIAANTVTADFTFSGQLAGTAGQVWLTTSDQDPAAPTDAIVVDLVGYGTVLSFEGAAAGSPPLDGSLERKASPAATASSMALGGADHAAGNAEDTDDNANDFVVQTVREPQNAAAQIEP
jgi:hypothetical protein